MENCMKKLLTNEDLKCTGQGWLLRGQRYVYIMHRDQARAYLFMNLGKNVSSIRVAFCS